LFLFGMALQYAYLFKDLKGFAISTALLYLLITLAYARAVFSLPRRAGVFSVVFGVQSLFSALIFCGCAFASGNVGGVSVEALLWVQVVSGPVCRIVYEVLVLNATAQSSVESEESTSSSENSSSCNAPQKALGMATNCTRWVVKSLERLLATSQLAWDVPVDHNYIINRFTGIGNLFIICSVIFPLSLLGAEFEKNHKTAAVILLANGYAILLKTTTLDLKTSSNEVHAVARSRLHAMAWMLLAPFEFIGIALSGVGFVSAVSVATGESSKLQFTQTLLCLGPVLTYGTSAALHALHSPNPGTEKSHSAKIATFLLSCLLFSVPLIFDLDVLITVITVLATAVFVIGAVLTIEYSFSHTVSEAWQWKAPKNQVEFEDQFKIRSPGVSSSEEFFTVLLAVAIYQLNYIASDDSYSPHTFMRYVVRLLVFYTFIDATMWYSCRFGEDDASHKLTWVVVEYVLLLILEGLGGDPGGANSLYKIAVAGLYVFISLMFLRVAYCSERSRRFSLFWGFVYSLSAVFSFGAAFQEGGQVALFIPVVAIYFVAQPVFYYGILWVASENRSAWDVPPNLSYIVHRFNSLFMEVLSVALIVPNAVYPGTYSHAYLVFGGDLLVIFMALSLKWALLDAEPVETDSFEHHAYGRGRGRRILFSKLNPFLILAIGLTGCSMNVLIKHSGMS
jgi:hypothetical protein